MTDRPAPDALRAPERLRARRDSRRLMRILTIACGFVWVATAGAATINERLLFTATDQSQWTNGAAGVFNTHGPQFLGIPAAPSPLFHAGDSIGKIFEKCVLFACVRLGAELGLTINGRAGLSYDVLISNGSLNITLPQRVSFAVPDALAIKQGGAFDIVSTLSPATTFTIFLPNETTIDGSHLLTVRPGLQTTGPTVQALVGMELHAHSSPPTGPTCSP